MSSIPTKQIDGDVAVGRNISAGGNANIQGNARVAHNLVVEGWLEAKNIKGPNKGHFLTFDKLKAAYPNPRNGWMALVGETLPAHLYIAEDGEWIPQMDSDGNPIMTGNPTIDSQRFEEALDDLKNTHSTDIAQLRRDHQIDVGVLQDKAQALTSLLEAVSALADKNETEISNIGDYIIPHEIEPKIDYNRELIDAIRLSVGARATVNEYGGETPGIAPLDTSGKIAARYLPSFIDDSMDFGGFAPEDVEFAGTKYTGDMQGTDPQVLFSRKEGVFILRVTPVSSTGRPQSPVYYPDWELLPEHELCLGTALAGGRLPLKTKTYYDPVTNKSYRWTGSSLAPTGSDIDLGDEAGTAFPGDRGRMVESFVTRLGPLLGPELMKDNTTLSRFITDVLEGLGLDEIAASYAPDMERKADRTELSTVLAGDVISQVTAPEVMQHTRQEMMWDLFDRMWTAAGGTVIISGVRYGLNGLDDITADEALKIWRMSYHQHRKSWVNAYGYGTGYGNSMPGRYFCRTYFPLVSMAYEPATNMQSIFDGNSIVEAVAIYGGYSNGGGHHNFAGTFRNCRALRRVVLTNSSFGIAGAALIHCNSTTFQGCVNLERIEGVAFWVGGSTLDLSMAPKFEIDCIEKLVAANPARSDWTNTIILHADTYAKVTDELLEAAAAKYITITTP